MQGEASYDWDIDARIEDYYRERRRARIVYGLIGAALILYWIDYIYG